MAPKISFYFDEHMPRAVARGLAQFEIRVVMAVDVEMVSRDDDTEHLRYATEHDLVLVTRDLPFAGRASKRSDHAGLICWTGSGDDFGGMIRRLAQFVDQNSSEIVQGSVFWIK
jgi:hypothetical protein